MLKKRAKYKSDDGIVLALSPVSTQTVLKFSRIHTHPLDRVTTDRSVLPVILTYLRY